MPARRRQPPPDPPPAPEPLDNLDLLIILISAPWEAPHGVRATDLEQLLRVHEPLIGGAIYFQRVNRAAARLVEHGLLGVSGVSGGPGNRYNTTPLGFAMLAVSMRTPRTDPTIDGSDFQLKRRIAEQLSLTPEIFVKETPSRAGPIEEFLGTVGITKVPGHEPVSRAFVADAFSVHALVERQRTLVELLKAQAEADLSLHDRRVTLGGFDPATFGRGIGGVFMKSAASVRVDGRDVPLIVTGGINRVSLRVTILRYDHELAFLDDVAALYKNELPDLRGVIADPGGEVVSQQEKPPGRPR